MGEKPTGRLLVLAGLLVTSLFIGMVSAESGDVALLVEETTPTEQPWYTPDSPLLLTPTLMNNGPDVSLTVNPSCPFVYNVYNGTGVMLVNGSATCPVREQGLDLFAGEQVDFEAVEWSMKDNDGQWLESGVYNVELLHSSGLSSTVEARIQTPVALPSELSYSVETTHRVDAEGPRCLFGELAQSIGPKPRPHRTTCLLVGNSGCRRRSSRSRLFRWREHVDAGRGHFG